MANQTIFKKESKVEIKKPNLYKVILLNDDYTTMEFVIEILTLLFHKTPSESTKIMLDVHEKGSGIVGLYSYDIAHTKVIQLESMAQKRDFPLKALIEAD